MKFAFWVNIFKAKVLIFSKVASFCELHNIVNSLNFVSSHHVPDSKVHGANMGPIWGRQDPDGPHVGPMRLVMRDFQLLTSAVDARPMASTVLTRKFLLLQSISSDIFVALTKQLYEWSCPSLCPSVHIFKSPRSGVTLCFRFVSDTSAAATTFACHVKTVWATS